MTNEEDGTGILVVCIIFMIFTAGVFIGDNYMHDNTLEIALATQEATEFCNKCYNCEYRQELPWSCHSRCSKDPSPKVESDPHGIKEGWFNFPNNFDPVWLQKCNSFKHKS